MEEGSYRQRTVAFITRNMTLIGIVIAGIVLLSVGTIQYLLSNDNSDLEFVKASDTGRKIKGESTGMVVVDVAGQVVKPGLYTLPSGSRLNDAIQAAEGFSSGADQEYISKKINLAQKIVDGGKIYIPAIGETPPATAVSSSKTIDADTSSTDISSSEGLIDINSASEAQLDKLPRVGPVTIEKIISGRPYASIEELVSKKVMGQATFNGLRDLITVQ